MTNIARPTIRPSCARSVTGGAGFIGSNLVDALVERGDEVIVVDDLSSGKRENVNPAATLRRARHPRRPRRSTGAEVVFHLAAQADVQTSVARPDYDASVNVRRHGRRCSRRRARGGRAGRLLLDRRRDLRRVRRAGARGRAAASRSRRTGSRSSAPSSTSPAGTGIHGTRHVALRFANVYGPRQESSLEGGVVAIFLERLARGERDDDLRRRRPDPRLRLRRRRRRRRCSPRPATTAASSTSAPATETTRARAAPRLRGGRRRRRAEPRFEPARLGDVRRSVLDVSRAERELGWRAATPLADGLRLTWDWLSGRTEPAEPANPGLALDAPLSAHDLVRPWRRATLVAS